MTELVAREEAIGWAIRLRDAASADWAAFTAWLEADPAHAAAYDAVTLADADMVDALAAQPVTAKPAEPVAAPAANDNQPGFFRRYGSLAAALLVCVSAYPAYKALTPTYVVQTALGEQRSVTLDDGTVIDLNGGTKLTLDRRNPRLAMLETGEARFHVTHDAENPFAVETGGVRIEDVGTVFNVAREPDQTEVSVAEGSVMFNPKREALLLKPGQKLVARGASTPVVTAVDPDTVAGWKTGRLDFSATPIGDIGPDLARALGTPVAVDPAIAGREFTGTIVIDRKDRSAMTGIAALMGVSARQTEEGWRLTAN